MKSSRRSLLVSMATCLLVSGATMPVATPGRVLEDDVAPATCRGPVSQPRHHRSFAPAALPLAFTMNRGQLNSRVRFAAQWEGSSVLLTNDEMIFSLGPNGLKAAEAAALKGSGPSVNGQAITTSLLSMRLRGANSAPRVEGLGMTGAVSNYFVGNDPRAWRFEVPSYSSVVYRGVYPGIDLVWHGQRGSLEYDFVVAPGRDPRRIQIDFSGARRLRVNEAGDLILSTPAGELIQRVPVAYQEVNGIRKHISARYTMKGKHRVGFQVGSYDRRRPLTIDPLLALSTPLGGDGSFEPRVATDSAGNVYLAGTTHATNLATPGAAQGSNRGVNAYVVKLDSSGTSVLWSTFLGGGAISGGVGTRVGGIAVDGEGQVYVAGTTAASDHPTTPGAFRRDKSPNPDCISIQGCFEGFVAKLSPSGTTLIYSTYLGGRAPDSCAAIAVDAQGSAYVTGYTMSPDFPTTPGSIQPEMVIRNGITSTHGFVAKLNAAGSALDYSTFLGGKGFSAPIAISVDTSGHAYVAGTTVASDFPTTVGSLQPEISPAEPGDAFTRFDIFVSKLDPQGGSLVYSTYLGGTKDDRAAALAIDAAGNAVVTGSTAVGTFPLLNPLSVPASGGRAFGSLDGGNAWAQLDNGLPDAGIRNLTIDPQTPSIIYAQTARGPYKSTNGGQNWNPINTGFQHSASGFYSIYGAGESILIDPQNSSVLYTVVMTAGDSGDLWKSIDGGLHWSRIFTAGSSDQASNAVALAITPNSSSTLYIANGRGVLKSVNGGASWSYVNEGLPSNTEPDEYPWLVNTVVGDPGNSSTYYAATTEGLYKTTNAASSWAPTALAQEVFDVAIDPTAPGTLYTYVDPRSIVLNNEDSGRGHPRRRIHSLTLLQGMLKSTNGGESWKAINRGLPDTLKVAFITIDPLNTSTIWAGGTEGLFKSSNGGGDWFEVSPPNKNVVSATADPTPSGTLYVCSAVSPTAFVAKLNATGSGLIYSTLLGGSQGGEGKAVAVDSAGNAYVAGSTRSTDLPTMVAFQPTNRGSSDVFVARLSSAGALSYSTYLGGRNVDGAHAIAVDGMGNAYVAGVTMSPDFPLVRPVEEDPIETGTRAFVAKIDPSRHELLPAPGPGLLITRVDLQGKHLVVSGSGFVGGATVVVDDRPQTTAIGGPGQLVGWKSGKKIKSGRTARVQVQNPDGTMSGAFMYQRP
jgi:photosystem II stability/assembly factor-like uncharacterized protein